MVPSKLLEMIVIYIKKIPDLQKIKVNKGSKSRTFYVPETSSKQRYIAVKEELGEKYSLSLHNRDTSIKQVIDMLRQGSNEFVPKIDLIVIRTDITNFFPSINKHSLYKKMTRNNYLSLQSIETLKEFLFNNKVKGLPQGIPFSSILSEFYLQDFDDDIITYFSPYLYQRYVDDILFIKIVSKYNTQFKPQEFKDLLDKIADSYDLSINKDKTEIVYFNKPNYNLDFNYLGYRFKTTQVNIEYEKQYRLDISISKSKFQKKWGKIYGIFQTYHNSDKAKVDYWKLYYKLINSIYGVTSINDKNEVLKFGLGFTYRYVNCEKQLEMLLQRIRYEIYKCDLTSNENFSLHQLLKFSKSPLEVLNRRFNYMNLTKKQLYIMHKQIDSKSKQKHVESFFYYLYKE